MRVGLALALCSGCLVSPVMKFGGGKTARQSQTEIMQDLRPRPLDAVAEWSGAVRTVKVRVWADDAYRAQNLKWQDTFGAQLDAANHVLAAKLGVRLVPEYHAWEHHAPGAELAEIATAIEAHDPGTDVFAVIALTSSISLVTATFEQLGIAKIHGRHLVVRGYADVEERKAFEFSFPDLEQAERDSTLDARRQHKTTVVLLHELGHILGFEHDAETDTIMNASYSRLAESFSAAARTTLAESIATRLGGGAAQMQVVKQTTPPIVVFVSEDGDLIHEGNIITLPSLAALMGGNPSELQLKVKRKAPPTIVEQAIEKAGRRGVPVTVTTFD